MCASFDRLRAKFGRKMNRNLLPSEVVTEFDALPTEMKNIYGGIYAPEVGWKVRQGG